MDKLIKFFKSKKLDSQFKGEGRRLNEPSRSQMVPTQAHNASGLPRSQNDTSYTTKKAAQAAIDRMNQKNRKPERPVARTDVQEETKHIITSIEEAEEFSERFQQKVVVKEKPDALARVLFWCPALLSDSMIAYRYEVDRAISDYLLIESNLNAAEAVTLILIRGLYRSKPPAPNTDSSAAQPDILELIERRKKNILRILQNLIDSPDNPTFRRLRAGNKLIQDLLSIDGMQLFLNGCGFTAQTMPISSDPLASVSEGGTEAAETETFYIMSEEDAKRKDHLEKMHELLSTGEPILPELYRDTHVFQVSGSNAGVVSDKDLSDDFFMHTKEEVRRLVDQQKRIIEESGLLMTKAMRERLKVQEFRLFRYVLIRVRLPGNVLIQGTFCATDSVGTVRAWITDCLTNSSTEYQLWAPPGTVRPNKSSAPITARVELSDNSATLVDLGLAPCSLLNLAVVGESSSGTSTQTLLCDELLQKMQPL